MQDPSRAVRLQLIGIVGLSLVVAAAIVGWVFHAGVVDHWLAVHTGTSDVSGVYYGFWSGFGSDLAEFGILGAIGTGVYQLVKKYNCHEPRCWRVGTHPAAGGQFLLCYRHHPDYRGTKPTHDLIVRMHQEHAEHEGSLRDRLHELNKRLALQAPDSGNVAVGAEEPTATDT